MCCTGMCCTGMCCTGMCCTGMCCTGMCCTGMFLCQQNGGTVAASGKHVKETKKACQAGTQSNDRRQAKRHRLQPRKRCREQNSRHSRGGGNPASGYLRARRQESAHMPIAVIPAKAGIPLTLATSASQRSAKRAHYSLDSCFRRNGGGRALSAGFPPLFKPGALRGNGGMGDRHCPRRPLSTSSTRSTPSTKSTPSKAGMTR